jgi:Global regulator protein family
MEVLGMFINLSAGDRLHIGESVTLTVLAVEGGLIHFGLESPEPVLLHAGLRDTDREDMDRQHRRGGWERN